MSFVDFFVAACVAVGVVSALMTALHPNILYAAVSLIFSLLSVAGLYGALGADFLAAAQLIIYVGGIIVVILFAVMMSEDIYQARFFANFKKFLAPFGLSLVMLFALLHLIKGVSWSTKETLERAATVDNLGRALVGPYALVFQYVAIVLLAGLIGAVIVARPEFGTKDQDERGNQ